MTPNTNPAPLDLVPRVRELEAALRYAARMLDPAEHDVAYILNTLQGGPDGLREAAKPLTWTREKPKRAGWYWYRNDGSRTICDVYMAVFGFLAHMSGAHAPASVKELDGEWAGPIPSPQDLPTPKAKDAK